MRTLLAKRPDALIVGADAILSDQRSRIAQFGLKYKIPVLGSVPASADAGALLVFGVPQQATFGRAAFYVKRILSGTLPADRPVEQPTKIELVVNLKTAKALGLKPPPLILHRTDRVVE